MAMSRPPGHDVIKNKAVIWDTQNFGISNNIHFGIINDNNHSRENVWSNRLD